MRQKPQLNEEKPKKTKTPNKTLEYVDWINEKGNVVGRIEKIFAHQHGILHPAGHVFVFDSKKRLILQYRSSTKRIYPQKWDTSVGGHIHAGGGILNNTQREAWEELGINVPLHYLGKALAEGKETNRTGTYYHREIIHYFYAQLSAKTKIKTNEEFENIAFVELEKMPAFIRTHPFTHSFLVGWKKFGKKLLSLQKGGMH